MLVETQPSAQSFFQILKVENRVRTTHQIRYYILEVLVHFYCICLVFAKYFDSDCLRKQILGRSFAQSPSQWKFSVFYVTSKRFSNHHVNIKQVSSVKSSKFNGFVLVLFCILVLGENLTLGSFQLCRLVVL